MSKIEQLLVEKHRPTNLDGYIFQSEENRAKVEKWAKKGSFPNVLISGGPGTGKTTLAQILWTLCGVHPGDVKVMNGSTLKTADIENELIPWMRKGGLSPFKVVFLDEMDRIDPNHGQKILRRITEEYSDDVRFIGTCNYPNKISSPLHSRFQNLHMDSMDYDGVLNLVADIIEQEELTFSNDEDLLSHIDAYEPDIRKILNSIDEHTSIDGVIGPLKNKIGGGDDIDLWEAIWTAKKGKFDLSAAMEAATYVSQENFEQFYVVMYENSIHFPDEGMGLVLLSRYMDRAKDSAYQLLHLHACLSHIFVVGSDDE